MPLQIYIILIFEITSMKQCFRLPSRHVETNVVLTFLYRPWFYQSLMDCWPYRVRGFRHRLNVNITFMENLALTWLHASSQLSRSHLGAWFVARCQFAVRCFCTFVLTITKKFILRGVQSLLYAIREFTRHSLSQYSCCLPT